ncbi:MAG: YIP1 family protein [Bacillaceae bacterium]|nr:YIP1 family protein [Bacillaceae bacterium]
MEKKSPSLVGMIFSPNNQLTAIKSYPLILNPLLIIVFLNILLVVLTTFSLDNTVIFQDKVPNDMFMAKMFFLYGAIISSTIVIIIKPLGYSALFSTASKVIKLNVKFKQLFSMFIYISIFDVLVMVLNLIQLQYNGGLPEQIFLPSALGFFIIAIWKMILVAWGLKIITNMSKTTSWLLASVYFVSSLLLNIMLGSISI